MAGRADRPQVQYDIEGFDEEAWAQALANAAAAEEAARQADEEIFSGAWWDGIMRHDDAVRRQAMLDVVVLWRQLVHSMLPRRSLNRDRRSQGRRRRRRNVRSNPRRARAPDDLPDELDPVPIGGGW
jgi:hypothetical protein